MREITLSNIEEKFILKAIAERTRLDGRDAFSYRQISVKFGTDSGCCFVDLGNTKVMAQVSCEVTVPKETRPHEGSVIVNVELSPMAAPHFEIRRTSDEAIGVNRLLERCLRDSCCVDTEALCIVGGQKVWTIRIDIHVIDYDGNIVDAASIAAIGSLLHFRLPDVTVCGNDVTLHSAEDRDPIPLSIRHMPLCVSFAFFETGKFLIVDPTQKEHIVADGMITVGMNKHREICLLQMSGNVTLHSEQVLRCISIAATKVAVNTEIIQAALHSGSQELTVGTSSVEEPVTTSFKQELPTVDMKAAEQTAAEVVHSDDDSSRSLMSESLVSVLDSGVATIGKGGPSCWEERAAEIIEEHTEALPVSKTVVKSRPSDRTIVLSSDSEEDVVMVVEPNSDVKKCSGAEPFHQQSDDHIDLTIALKSKKTRKPL